MMTPIRILIQMFCCVLSMQAFIDPHVHPNGDDTCLFEEEFFRLKRSVRKELRDELPAWGDLLRKYDSDNDGNIGLTEWNVICHEYPALIDPLRVLQKRLVKRTLGKRRWKTVKRFRQQVTLIGAVMKTGGELTGAPVDEKEETSKGGAPKGSKLPWDKILPSKKKEKTAEELEKEMRVLMDSEKPDKISIKQAVDVLYNKRIGRPWASFPIPQPCIKRRYNYTTGQVVQANLQVHWGQLEVHPIKWKEDFKIYWNGQDENEYQAKVVYALKIFEHEAYRKKLKLSLRHDEASCSIDGHYNARMPLVVDSMPSNAHLDPKLVGLGREASKYDEIDHQVNAFIRYQNALDKTMQQSTNINLDKYKAANRVENGNS